MLNLRIELDIEPVLADLRRFRTRRIPELRTDYVRRVGREVLHHTIRRNPVDTARSRASWVKSLERLGDRPRVPWRGPFPVADAIREGRTKSLVQRRSGRFTTSLAIANHVEYVPHLEYGTFTFGPFAMARTSLKLVGRDVAKGRIPFLPRRGHAQ